jgi:predicted DNA-binding WGR domain protein
MTSTFSLPAAPNIDDSKMELSRQKIRQKLIEQAERNKQNKDKFFRAWKDGISLLDQWGKVLFRGDITIATDREELRPNWNPIDKSFGVLSTGEQIFVGIMYSFFNPDDGQDLLKRAGHENFVDAISRLSHDHRNVIVRLINSHYGW